MKRKSKIKTRHRSLFISLFFITVTIVLFQNFDRVPGLTYTRELPRGLSASEVKLPAGETLDPAMVELGSLLFFDRRLSPGAAMACATCHAPSHGFTDPRIISTGIKGNQIFRQTPAAFNRLFSVKQGWTAKHASLEAQSIGPITNPDEMGLDEATLVQVISANAGYKDRFNRLVSQGLLSAPAVSPTNVSRAIGTFTRAGLLIGDSWADRYDDGDASALTAQEVRGRTLFFGKARCFQCHSGSNFTDEALHSVGLNVLAARFNQDLGLAARTGLSADRGKFKTPTLRNIAQTAPYFHDRSAATLEAVVAAYNAGPVSSLNPDPLIVALGMTAAEQADLVAFLKALTGTLADSTLISSTGTSSSPAARENILLSQDVYVESEYRALNPDLAAMTSAQLQSHWLSTGINEGRQASHLFSVKEYLNLYENVNEAYALLPNRYRLAIDHYLNYGRRYGYVGRGILHPDFFNADHYRAANASVANSIYNVAVRHWLRTGQSSRLISKTSPRGDFQVGANFYESNGSSACMYSSQASFFALSGRINTVGVPKLNYVPPNLTVAGTCTASTMASWTGGVTAFNYGLVPQKWRSPMVRILISEHGYMSSTQLRAIAIAPNGLGYVTVNKPDVVSTQAIVNRITLERCAAVSGQRCALLAAGGTFALNRAAMDSAFTFELVKPSTMSANNLPFTTPSVVGSGITNYLAAASPKALAISVSGKGNPVYHSAGYPVESLAEAKRIAMQRCELGSSYSPCMIFAENNTIVFDPAALNRAPTVNYALTAVPASGSIMGINLTSSAKITSTYRTQAASSYAAVYMTANGAFGYSWGHGSQAAADAAARDFCTPYESDTQKCFRFASRNTVVDFRPALNFMDSRDVHCKTVVRNSCASHHAMGCGKGAAYYVAGAGGIARTGCP